MQVPFVVYHAGLLGVIGGYADTFALPDSFAGYTIAEHQTVRMRPVAPREHCKDMTFTRQYSKLYTLQPVANQQHKEHCAIQLQLWMPCIACAELQGAPDEDSSCSWHDHQLNDCDKQAERPPCKVWLCPIHATHW
jgi:hypothetical protein